jgi:hypothetical protein
MTRFATIIFYILLPGFLFSQHLPNAAGIRGGVTSGIEFRHFLSGNNSARFLLGVRHQGLQLYTLFEHHQFAPFSLSEQFTFVYGAGIHFGYHRWKELTFQSGARITDMKTKTVYGVDGLIGLEYIAKDFPLSLGVEYKPLIDFGGQKGVEPIFWDFAFTVRYLF